MTYIDDIVAFTATAEPSADDADWTAVRSAVDAATTENTDVGDAETAYAVGCAVAERVAAVLDSAPAARGWSRRSVAGAIGAGAAVGRLLRFDDTRLRHLLGLCATQATGLRSLDDTEAGELQVAKAASDAVEAALLVSHGFTSSADGLSGRRGLFALMAPGSASW